MIKMNRRTVLRGAVGWAAAGTVASPFIANAQSKTATVLWVQGFVKEEDQAFNNLVAAYEKASGNKIQASIIPFGPAMQKIAFERAQKPAYGRGAPDDGAIAGELKTVAELLPVLDAALAGREWVTGALSIADFALASTFMLRQPARMGVEAHANVAGWIERLEARPSWVRAIGPYLEVQRARGLVLG